MRINHIMDEAWSADQIYNLADWLLDRFKLFYCAAACVFLDIIESSGVASASKHLNDSQSELNWNQNRWRKISNWNCWV